MMRQIGINYNYPKIRKILGEKIAAYIRLCRPFTGLAPLLAGLFGVLSQASSISLYHMLVGLCAGITLMTSQFVGQIINQFADADLDRLLPNKKNRPIPSGMVSQNEALGLAWLLALASVLTPALIGNTFFLFFVVLCLFFGVFYSLPPLSPRKYSPVLSLLWMAVSRGFLPMIAVLSIFGSIETALKYSVLGLIWVFGFQGTKDVQDVEADRAFGVKTIPNTYGISGLVRVMCISLAAFTAFLLAIGAYQMILVSGLGVVAILTINKRSSVTENNYAWACFYIGLGLIYVLIFSSRYLP